MTNSLKKIKIEVQDDALYAKSEKIYPREIAGRYQTLRDISMYLLLGLYYVMPWVQWGDRQAVLFDLPARKFHIFFLTFWPQDFVFLALLLIMAGLALFFFTAIAGRVWCGFACPQTVWTEAFIKMERWVEGTRNQQMKLSEMPWNLTKIRKRGLKQFLWISFSLVTGLTFVGYFVPMRELVTDFYNLEIAGWSLFWVFFYGFATYGNAGFMREQVCKHMCPYARFQSAMFDHDTLIVAYDQKRGDPRSRGKKRETEDGQAAGDCIDCGICVQVCPTGIDIRDGLQYECIACAACIDACDEVMDRIDLPKGLIKYSTEGQDQGNGKSLLQTLLRARILVYGVLLTAIVVGFVVSLAMRSPFQVDILRDRNALYRWSENNELQNSYQIKMINKGQFDQQYEISISGVDNAQVVWSKSQTGSVSRMVPAGAIGDFTAIVSLPEAALSTAKERRSSQTIEFTFKETNGQEKASVIEESRFWSPGRND